LEHHQQPPDELQVIDQLLDLDQLLLEVVAPAFSAPYIVSAMRSN
jgi:hypothetical protein